ncbi:MAG: MMPL family transporter, partial [Gammaproteobacteria bacterium]|nr:MMPL family transporter [Gammaproteobacteria bacterium]
MPRRGLGPRLICGLLALLAVLIVVRATYTADLSAFLPRRASATQQLLIEQLRAGPATHLIIAEVSGSDARARAQLSSQLARLLRAEPAFTAVSNGDASQLERDRKFLFDHRYLLSPEVAAYRFTAAGLHEAISNSLDALTSPEGTFVKPFFTHDPTGEMLAILESLGAGRAPPHTTLGAWTSPDGERALLLAQTRASGSDTDGQAVACEVLRRDFALARSGLPGQGAGLTISMSGPPVFAVDSRAMIKGQVLRLSAVSAGLIAALLLTVYRSPAALALTFLPVACGALAGIAAVALGFGSVHGITLGFGVTLIGEAVDYSIYLLIPRRSDFHLTVWPTLRLGVLTSICGFAALLPSTFPGLEQLGVFSIAGLVAAALVTRFVLPDLMPRTLSIRDLTRLGERLARAVEELRDARAVLLAVPVLAGAVFYLRSGAVFSHELATLSAIPRADEQLDERLRADSGAPAWRYFAVLSAPDREAALEGAQQLAARLTRLVDDGILAGFESPSRYLPSRETQQARRASLPAAGELARRLQEALAGLPVSASRLQPFLHDVEAARTAALLTPADLAGTSFAQAVQGLAFASGAGWSVLLPLSPAGPEELAPGAAERVRDAIAGVANLNAQFLDMKREADDLYTGYLRGAVILGAAGLGLIIVLLLATLRSASRAARVMAPLVLAVVTVAAVLVCFGRPLT